MTVVERTTVIPDGSYEIDPLHSSASFAVRHAVSTFRGGFKAIEGELRSGDGSSTLTGSAEVESIDVDDDQLRPHLLSPEFFDLERSPQIRFTSTAIEAEGDELVVRGRLELAGSGHEVEARGHATAPAPGPGGAERIGLELRSEIDRTDYGIDWNMELPGGGSALGDEVELVVTLELIREG